MCLQNRERPRDSLSAGSYPSVRCEMWVWNCTGLCRAMTTFFGSLGGIGVGFVFANFMTRSGMLSRKNGGANKVVAAQIKGREQGITTTFDG
jgi:hypothetical protein